MSSSQVPKKRVAFVLIDGLADVSLPRLGFKTPLQSAKLPNLDAIASAGVNGLMDPVEAGLACGSDTAHLSLLGYDPRVYYRGRGAFESMGAGLAMSPGDIAFKSNFATLDEKTGIVTSRRADRHFEEEGPVLCAALDGLKLPSFPQYEVRVRYATEHRCGVVVKGPNLSGNISGTDPLKDNRLLLKAEALDDSHEARNTAAVVNELSKEITKILVSHPVNAKRVAEGKNIANVVLLRGCGIRIEVTPFLNKHGLRPCMVAPTKIIAGLGLSLGIDILDAPGATGQFPCFHSMALITTQPKNPIFHRCTTLHRSIPRRDNSTTVLGLGSIKNFSFDQKQSKISLKNNPFCYNLAVTAKATANAAFGGGSEAEGSLKHRRILLSEVEVKRERSVFFGRKWNSLDVGTAGMVLVMHVLCLFAPFHFNWPAFWVAVALYVVTGLFGITLSFHRNLSHRSFKLPKWLEYFFAYCGALALQGNPIDWVSTHRYHHQFCDSERDPHSPTEGFWFSHMSWLFDTNSIIERCGEPNNVVDLEKQPFYRLLRSTYLVHPFALGALLYAAGGFPFLVWGMGVRIVWVYHITWFVNSACHVWGNQAWNTRDLSRNNWWVALLAFGEGWHNNHHAFEYSARHGLEWWQLDMTWYVVRFLQAVGLATEVKLPTESQKQRMAFNSDTITT